MDEIAARLSALIAEHGPRSVAIYVGTYSGPHPATTRSRSAGCSRPARACSSRPPRSTSRARTSRTRCTAAGSPARTCSTSRTCGCCVGNNPLISMSGGIPPANPARRLREAQARGTVAHRDRPALHRGGALRRRLSAAAARARTRRCSRRCLHVVIRDGLVDSEFVARHVAGFAELEAAVAPFTPAFAAERAGVLGGARSSAPRACSRAAARLRRRGHRAQHGAARQPHRVPAARA